MIFSPLTYVHFSPCIATKPQWFSDALGILHLFSVILLQPRKQISWYISSQQSLIDYIGPPQQSFPPNKLLQVLMYPHNNISTIFSWQPNVLHKPKKARLKLNLNHYTELINRLNHHKSKSCTAGTWNLCFTINPCYFSWQNHHLPHTLQRFQSSNLNPRPWIHQLYFWGPRPK